MQDTSTMSLDRFWVGLFRFLFRDEARPVEILSGLTMAGWAWALFRAPQLLDREGYQAFEAMPAYAWCALMAAIALVQFAAMLPVVPSRGSLRFGAMTLSAGVWTIVAINFVEATVPTTGSLTYSGLAIVTALTGVWCAWNRS